MGRDLPSRRDALRLLPWLASSTDEQLDQLLELSGTRSLTPGEDLMRQGDSTAEAYLVIQGELDVTTNGVLRETIGPGTLVGEMALLAEGPRMSTLTARCECELLVLGEEAFAVLLALPGASTALAAEMARRLRHYVAAAPEPDREAWDLLTPAERQVATLVAQGLTNGAVAERLVLSKHTVESHLKHIFAKLGISSRMALAIDVVPRRSTR